MNLNKRSFSREKLLTKFVHQTVDTNNQIFLSELTKFDQKLFKEAHIKKTEGSTRIRISSKDNLQTLVY